MTMLPLWNSKIIPGIADTNDATAMCFVPSRAHGRSVLMGIRADYSAPVSLVRDIIVSKATTPGDLPLEALTLARGSTDTNVSSTAFHYSLTKVGYYKAAVAAGTALAAGTIPANTWGIYRLSIDAAGTITVTAGAANFTTGYASEAAAITALPALPASSADMGYLTVLTAVGLAFIGGTDALQGGTSGNPSSDTNYYAASPATWTSVDLGALTRWDFSKGPFFGAVPGLVIADNNEAMLLTLEASGTGGTTGTISAWLVAP